MEWIDVPKEGLSLREIRKITKRDQAENADIRNSVEAIVADVQQRGDAAIREYTEKFDGVCLDSFLVTPEEIEAATQKVGGEFMDILEEAASNIRAYHQRQVEQRVLRI